MKIAMLFPYAPLYRETIYLMMDKQFEIDWYFCNNSGHGLKQMDYSKFKSVNLSLSEKRFGIHSFWYTGILTIPFSIYDYVFIPGQTHCLVEWYIAIRYGNKKKGPKIVFWTHGWYGKESFIQRCLKHIYFHFADGLLVYGDRAKHLMINEGIEERKIFPIHNSLDYDTQRKIRKSISLSNIYITHFANTNPVLIFIGRLTKVKELHLLIKAIAILHDTGQDYNVVLVGDGEEKESLHQLAQNLGVIEQVWFYGECYDEHNNAELIYNADLCVAPGNIGLTAMHSLIFGTPCMTHNSFEWQMPEFESIKEGITGGFFKYRDEKSLAESITKWFEDKSSKREEVRRACINEIDSNWNPHYQINVLKDMLNILSNNNENNNNRNGHL